MDEWVTTSTILVRLRDFDDRDVWERFVQRFRAPIMSFARTLGLNEADASDAAQETLIAFLKAYRNGSYDPAKGSLNKWLFGIAYRQVVTVRRGRDGQARQVAGDGDGTTLLAQVPDHDTAAMTWDVEWERAVLESCLDRVRAEVNETTYQAFDLIVRQGISPEEAAARLSMSRAAVYNAKHRVLKRAREFAEAFER